MIYDTVKVFNDKTKPKMLYLRSRFIILDFNNISLNFNIFCWQRDILNNILYFKVNFIKIKCTDLIYL